MMLEQALVASIGLGIFACIGLILRGWVEVRFRFSGFLKAERPDLWSQLAPSHSALEEAVTLRVLSFDPTPSVSKFRRHGFLELEDAELSVRCAHANRAERLAILSCFVLLAWTVIVLGIIVALRAS